MGSNNNNKRFPDENYEPISWSENNELFIENCKIGDIASEFGTPLYVISETQLRNNARLFQAVFSDCWEEGSVRILPAIKANYSLALRNILTDEGCGCDTFSYGEMWAALESGIDPYLISLNGNGKLCGDMKSIKIAVENGVRITIDDPGEVAIIEETAKKTGKTANVRLRLRPEYLELYEASDFSEVPISIEFIMNIYKHGIPTNHVVPLARYILESNYFNLTGVHIHLGRNKRDTKYWSGMMRGYCKLIGMLKKELGGWEPVEIDIGGGIPSRRDPSCGQVNHEDDSLVDFYNQLKKAAKSGDGSGRHKITEKYSGIARAFMADIFKQNPLKTIRPPLRDYAETITTALRTELKNNGISSEGKILEVEPGRGLYGDAGVHLTSVAGLKTQTDPVTWNWLNVDTTESFIADCSLEHALFRYMIDGCPITSRNSKELISADIVGSSCNFDRIVPDAIIPKNIKKGDLVMFLDTGAYEDPSASNFNAIPRPATVLVSGSTAELIKRGETQADVFARDIIPERLKY